MNKRTELRLGAPHPAGVGVQATAEVAGIPQQAVGSMTFPIIPELFGGVEFRGIGWELLQMPSGIRLLDRRERRPAVNRALIPEDEDRATQVAHQSS